jgi:hypothetical protein
MLTTDRCPWTMMIMWTRHALTSPSTRGAQVIGDGKRVLNCPLGKTVVARTILLQENKLRAERYFNRLGEVGKASPANEL